MLRNCDHVTVAVDDIAEGRAFFELLGFEAEHDVVISGDMFASYMNIDGLEAQHLTMALKGAHPRFEIQLLNFRSPTPQPDQNAGRLGKLGLNHVCFSVDDIEAEVARLKAAGVEFLNDIMDFNGRRLVFFRGPGDIVLELADWK